MEDSERKLSPRLLPKLNNEVDFTTLDYQDVNTFLSSFSSSDKSNVTKQMAKQLKSLRAVLSISRHLTKETISDVSIQNVIQSTANIISAEQLFLLEMNCQQGDLVVRHSQSSDGIRAPSDTGIEAVVIAQKKGLIVNDISSVTSVNLELYKQLHISVKNFILVPILCEGTVMGLLLAVNKQADDCSFSSFDMNCLEAIAVNLSVIYQISIQSKLQKESNQLTATENKSQQSAPPGGQFIVNGQFDCSNVHSTLCVEDQAELEKLFDWHFNVLNIKNNISLHYAVVALFDKECNFEELRINRETFYAYVTEVDRNYLQNPFHNFRHGICVTHYNSMLLNASDAKTHLSPMMMFASLLSALVHDVAHPGNTNMFEINIRSDLSILYNDTSVLENHHCSTAFRLMNKKCLDLFENIEYAERADIRKMMIACIIATDMHYHVSLIELIANRASQETWIIDSFAERMNYGKILLHAADLSNPTRLFPVSKAWATLVSEEFNAQGEREKEAGIPVSTFLLSHDLKSFVKSELFFSGHIVFPMWKELARLFPSMSHITDQVNINLSSWKELIK